MDADQFDLLATRMSTLRTRRRSLATLGVIGLAAVALAEEAEGKGKGKKKRKRRKKRTTTSTTPAPTCSDDIRNGSETGVDCGGSCPRCANGQACGSVADCTSARCAGGVCAACAVDMDCAAGGATCACDAGNGTCFNVADYTFAFSCDACPAGTGGCLYDPAGLMFKCYPRCGTVFPA
ncbi:MAG: hypothetical protein QM692_09670 [Thermomicrobiales bacterium]